MDENGNKVFKFRVWISGRFVYSTEVAFVFEDDIVYYIDSYGDCYDVEPADVEQYIATDKNGKDVYETDKVIYPDGGFVEPNTGDWICRDKPFEAWVGNVDDICNGDLVLWEGDK